MRREVGSSRSSSRAAASTPSARLRRAGGATGDGGTTTTTTDGENASVRFTVQRRRRGRPRIAGAFTHHGRAGANAFMFTGRVRKRRLPVGRYTLVASATGRAGKAAARARARFTIVR